MIRIIRNITNPDSLNNFWNRQSFKKLEMKVYFFLAIICCSCSSIKKNTSTDLTCNENITFKKQFMGHIKIIDDFMSIESKTEFTTIDEFERVVTKQRIDEFESSLKFISKYTHVSFESMANYAGIYPITAFEKDKKGWLEWYGNNKCNNIQFK